jgi:hypothetical protein
VDVDFAEGERGKVSYKILDSACSASRGFEQRKIYIPYSGQMLKCAGAQTDFKL